MKVFAAHHAFTFPYVIDTTQEVARAYDFRYWHKADITMTANDVRFWG
jgi:peroxiredoxin